MKKLMMLSLLLLATAAFAGDRNLTFSTTTNVNGTKLQPGEYQVNYKVNGSTADVQIKKGKEVVATASGQVVETERKTSRDSVVTTSNGDGTSRLVEIQFANQKTVIRLNDEVHASSGGAQ